MFVACSLWILKYAILEFFKRLNVNWRRTYDLALIYLRGLLFTTFVAVVVSGLAECQPFSNYWQVLPDPGGRCRQGYAQLLTMAVCNVVTDLTLVVFPVPVILSSSMRPKRKFHLVLLFSLSLAPVVITVYRVPYIIRDSGSQQTRSLYASIELLFATAAANALVLGSFVRDRGVKKRRYKYDSGPAGSVDRSSASESRRPTVLKHWGSDEDLVRDLGLGVKPELRDLHPTPSENRLYVPAAAVDLQSWRFPGQDRPSISRSEDPERSIRSESSATHRRVSFFDYGGLLDDQASPNRRPSSMSSDQSGVPPTAVPRPAVPASGTGFRRGSAALLKDVGGFLAPPSFNFARPRARTDSGELPTFNFAKPRARTNSGGDSPPVPPAQKEELEATPPPPPSGAVEKGEPQLMDVGGLLAPEASPPPPPPLPSGAAKEEPQLMDVGGLLTPESTPPPPPSGAAKEEPQLMDVGGLLEPLKE